jgi:hypothetical protein
MSAPNPLTGGLIANDEGVAGVRARELYKYFQPPPSNNTLATSKSSSPDSQLVALAQLCAFRLDCQRALISLIDRDLQYFVAEATRTLDLKDTSHSEDPNDAIWAGVSARLESFCQGARIVYGSVILIS